MNAEYDLDDFEPPCPSVQCPAAPGCGCVGTRALWSLDPREDDEE